MGVNRTALFSGGGEPAAPGTYGEAPSGLRLPDTTRLGAVRLQVGDLARSVDYYERVLGLRTVRHNGGHASLAPHGDDRALVELEERPGARPAPRRGRLGLYHFAILLPNRESLGRFVRHLAEQGVMAGAADHLVSEALYLQDPDNLGIEVYADRPRFAWRRSGRELMMATDPLDLAALAAAGGPQSWSGMPPGTVMGHVHLHVGNLEQAAAYFSDGLGFDRIVWSYPGALFMSAGGYHHHLGTNTWAGASATPPQADEAKLLEWTIELPDADSVRDIQRSLAGAGHPADQAGDDVLTHDPWGTSIRLRAS